MQGGAADARCRWCWRRSACGVSPGAEPLAHPIDAGAELVGGIVLRVPVAAGFQRHHAQPGRGQAGQQRRSAGAGADHHRVHDVRRAVTPHARRASSTVAPPVPTLPARRCRRAGSRAWRRRRRHSRCRYSPCAPGSPGAPRRAAPRRTARRSNQSVIWRRSATGRRWRRSNRPRPPAAARPAARRSRSSNGGRPGRPACCSAGAVGRRIGRQLGAPPAVADAFGQAARRCAPQGRSRRPGCGQHPVQHGAQGRQLPGADRARPVGRVVRPGPAEQQRPRVRR